MRARDMRILQNEKASAHRWYDVLIVVVRSPIDLKVMICIQLPEFTVEHVEVFVGEVLTDYVDVVLTADVLKGLHQVRQFEVPPRYLVVIIRVNHEEYSHHHSVGVPVLELGSGLKKFQARVCIQ